MPHSFAQLIEKENPTPEEVLETLKDYADTGLTIDAETVNTLISRANPSDQQLNRIEEEATKGADDQRERGCLGHGEEYLAVAIFVQSLKNRRCFP